MCGCSRWWPVCLCSSWGGARCCSKHTPAYFSLWSCGAVAAFWLVGGLARGDLGAQAPVASGSAGPFHLTAGLYRFGSHGPLLVA